MYIFLSPVSQFSSYHPQGAFNDVTHEAVFLLILRARLIFKTISFPPFPWQALSTFPEPYLFNAAMLVEQNNLLAICLTRIIIKINKIIVIIKIKLILKKIMIRLIFFLFRRQVKHTIHLM